MREGMRVRLGGSGNYIRDSPRLSEEEIKYPENLYPLAQARQLRWFARRSNGFRHWLELPTHSDDSL